MATNTEKKALSLNLDNRGQMFAGVATIRAAIADVLDAGEDATGCTCSAQRHAWSFSFSEGERETENRSRFMDAVIKRIGELQTPPHEGIKLENLCPRHRREALPAPTARICSICEAERKSLMSGQCVFRDGICIKCGKAEY